MKRSEMISIIEDVLFEGTDMRTSDVWDIAEELIVKIEEVGMLPPLTKDALYQCYTSDHDSRDIAKARNYFKWETE